MGWGEEHKPAPVPVATTGTTRQIADAMAAIAAVGVHGDNLALAAIEAAGVIDRTRERLVRETRSGR